MVLIFLNFETLELGSFFLFSMKILKMEAKILSFDEKIADVKNGKFARSPDSIILIK